MSNAYCNPFEGKPTKYELAGPFFFPVETEYRLFASQSVSGMYRNAGNESLYKTLEFSWRRRKALSAGIIEQLRELCGDVPVPQWNLLIDAIGGNCQALAHFEGKGFWEILTNIIPAKQ